MQRSNYGFPHESTGDQFFDEAQWESYRKLGETMIDRLLGAEDERRNNLFRVIAEAMDRHEVPPP